MYWLDEGLLVRMEMCASVTLVAVHEKTLKVEKIRTAFDIAPDFVAVAE